VGLTEEEARQKYKDNIKIGRFPFIASGKALTLGERQGFVKIISDSKYNEILGIHILGPNATELAAEAALAIKLECTAEELADTIHAHPTLSEAVMEASFDLLGEPIHKM
jgi:dihydrolipoamide dehydrogenase